MPVPKRSSACMPCSRLKALFVNWRSEITAPDWKNGCRIRLGGVVPVVLRLGAGTPTTCDPPQGPAARCVTVSTTVPCERSAQLAPGRQAGAPRLQLRGDLPRQHLDETG